MNKFLLLFITVPLVEMLVLIKVGEQIGALSTIALVILTAAIGISLLKRQGIAMLNRANWKMNQGEIPAKEMAEGIVLAVGGALLLTPGFVTDALGFVCLLPGSRNFLLSKVLKNISVNPIHRSNTADYENFHTHQQYQSHQQPHEHHRVDPTAIHRGDQNGDVIDGEFERKK
ncbi:FxsA family protein [Oceanospirillum beijerinckii]|uniref:FxsA family protein n=1 Tax=Oceanospirillum beijerinckii TaxID=64976 RepID=UPI0004198F5B|nr:FxsA family protein [Oceanospirillum beijerinckii]